MKTIRSEHHYTLVEIMTVIVIATILFGIGIPAFSTMIRGSNMTVAIRQLSAKIQAARAYAVTNRCRTAVLLAETGVRDDYCYSAYRVCVVDDSNKWQSWIEDEDWKTLPKGILRAQIANTVQISGITSGTDVLGSSPPNSFNGLIFTDKGQLTATGNVTINLRQGRYIEGNSPPMVSTERDSSGIINHPIEITQYTGKVKVKDITHASE